MGAAPLGIRGWVETTPTSARCRRIGYSVINRPPPKPLHDAQMGGAFFDLGSLLKPSLSWDAQVDLLVQRGLVVSDRVACAAFLAANNYYRFSGYMRYFQKAPHLGDNSFQPGTAFEEIRAIYDADEALRSLLSQRLARVEVLLRTHTAYVIANAHGPCGRYLEQDFYTDAANSEPTVESCLKDIERSRERHILRYTAAEGGTPDFTGLPVWSAVEAFSFGTLSKCIERGGQGSLADAVATSIGVAKAGFPYRVRALVYLRNRCAHHSRLWHHSVIDAGPTPNNVRVKAKKLAGQFEHGRHQHRHHQRPGQPAPRPRTHPPPRACRRDRPVRRRQPQGPRHNRRSIAFALASSRRPARTTDQHRPADPSTQPTRDPPRPRSQHRPVPARHRDPRRDLGTHPRHPHRRRRFLATPLRRSLDQLRRPGQPAPDGSVGAFGQFQYPTSPLDLYSNELDHVATNLDRLNDVAKDQANGQEPDTPKRP